MDRFLLSILILILILIRFLILILLLILLFRTIRPGHCLVANGYRLIECAEPSHPSAASRRLIWISSKVSPWV